MNEKDAFTNKNNKSSTHTGSLDDKHTPARKSLHVCKWTMQTESRLKSPTWRDKLLDQGSWQERVSDSDTIKIYCPCKETKYNNLTITTGAFFSFIEEAQKVFVSDLMCTVPLWNLITHIVSIFILDLDQQLPLATLRLPLPISPTSLQSKTPQDCYQPRRISN